MRVLIAGSSGLIGSTVSTQLERQGHQVVRLVRHAPGAGEVQWDPDAGTIDAQGLEGFDAVVHLASMPWTGRWTSEFKRRIRDNRLRTNGLLTGALANCERKPRVLVCASGQGAYAPSGDQILTESSSFGTDFLAQLQRDGEAATAGASAAGIRVVHLRITAVLGGPNLDTMTKNVRRLGNGRQWRSWVALDELPSIVEHALATDALSGSVNVASPNPVRNAEFVETLARVLGRKSGWPMPAFLLRILLGEMADQFALGSRRLEPRKLLATGYQFRFPELEAVLRHELGGISSSNRAPAAPSLA
jgi:uncharacterized protein